MSSKDQKTEKYNYLKYYINVTFSSEGIFMLLHTEMHSYGYQQAIQQIKLGFKSLCFVSKYI